ncbi:LPS export ABC transporter periplasmic protein LptC [Bartonella sp. HY406]|uniref:LPS export ABC transporter periplasmic protein LptC n=1 Tax=Bartonella sp. HY406 TaxID=2979331 RepID=UPI0021CA2255|nr:LPS export ABC transporter periplasmic protein LptC [Bartonella sp. HY406]UXN03670.1 LPS export ABC transporter periplasmic protein LptC [Bartonella sp. HY406]
MDDRQNSDSSIFSTSVKKDSVFLAAMKHSSRVKYIKILLPIIAVMIAAVFAWFTFFAARPTADVVALNTDGNDKLVMTSPKIEGYSKSQKPYSFNASRAVQDPLKPGLIELEDITAKMPLGERAEAEVSAIGGIYDSINGRMVLEKPFTVTTSDGVNASFKSADINIETSQLTTNEPVEIIRDREHLTADSLSIKENGQVFIFNGRVQLVIAPQEADNKTQ